MRARLALLCVVVIGCATAPVRDEDAERLDKATGRVPADQPADGLAYGQESGHAVAPAGEPLDAPSPYGDYTTRRRRRITPTSDVYVPPVTVSPGP